MLRPRVIPCLLIHKQGLVKTIGFANPKYVGDPINTVRIFNEKQVDEILVLDIDASVNGVEPDYKSIENLAAECQMPMCYGGGVRTAAQANKIVGLGVEKVAVSSAAIDNPDLVTGMADQVGSQSVVVVLDAKRRRLTRGYEVYTHNGRTNTKKDPEEFARLMQKHGAGEIVVNSIDNDGRMQGYDLELADKVRRASTLPLTVLGGAGSFDDLKLLARRYGVVGAAAGSIFLFKGKYRAVLISYPSVADRQKLVSEVCPPDVATQ